MDDGDYRGTNGFGMIRENVTALIAASFPAKPPRVWFDNPNFTGLSPLTIENSGQVRGHIASWKQSHIGMGGSVRAPKSKSQYAFFQTGALETDDDKMVNVGQITLAGGHAALDASVADAVAHYDNTDSAVMDVAVGEDRHGIWVAGALRPGLPEADLRSIRASSVSGDWRPINGNLELVAVCAVNVPGFPIPRARVAAGAPVALIAAGTAELVQVAMEQNLHMDIEAGIQAGLTEVNARIEAIEAKAADPTLAASEHRENVDAEITELVAAADEREQTTELRTRVHKDSIAASLRSRVHPKS